MRLLMIEDDPEIVDFVSMEMEHENYALESAPDGRSGLDMALNGDYDMILLDIMLPGLNGLEVLRRLRVRKSTPVIMLTARDDVMDKVAGLDAGANDYITKPFHIEELFARIRAIARITGAAAAPADSDALINGDIRMERRKRSVTRAGNPVALTKTQFDLLEYLMLNQDIVLSRDQILGAVWGYSYAGDSNVVDVYVRYVRIKLGEPADSHLIESVRGIGYVMRKQV